MAKITLPTITNGQDLSTLNSNFQSIATQLNLNVAYRLNIGAEDNTYAQDLDFNGHKIYNLSDVLVNGVSVLTLTQTANTAIATATAAATAASASQVAAAGSATSANASAIAAAAAASASGSLIAANNLSDLTNVTTAKTNLALQNVTNTSDVNKPVSTAQQTALNLKADLISPNFTSPTTGSTPVINDASGLIPNTLWVNAYFAKLSGATFTSINVPSRASGDSSSNAASTAFVYGTLASPQIGWGSAIPASVAATTISATGLITPANTLGIKGCTGAVAMPAGSIGELIGPATATATAMVTAVSQSVGVISLTAGIWAVSGTATFTGSVANMSIAYLGISTTLNSLGALGDYNQYTFPAVVNLMTVSTPIKFIRVTTSTLVYITGNINITTGTATMASSFQAVRIA